MATERLSMRKTREILRHKWVLGLGYRDVANSVDVSLDGVWLVVDRAKKAGLDWPTGEALDDTALEARVHTRDLEVGLRRPIPDCARIDLERRRVPVKLPRKSGLTQRQFRAGLPQTMAATSASTS